MVSLCNDAVKTYHFCAGDFFGNRVIEVVGLTYVEAAIDLNFEFFTIGIVKETFLIKLNCLPLSAFLEQIFASGITDRGLLL